MALINIYFCYSKQTHKQKKIQKKKKTDLSKASNTRNEEEIKNERLFTVLLIFCKEIKEKKNKQTKY